MSTLYRIAWMSLLTGACGAGMYILSLESAIDWRDKMNEKYIGSLIHWIEINNSPCTHVA
jgi:hypothetical protein